MRSLLLALLAVAALSIPGWGPAAAMNPGKPNEVEVVMDSNDVAVTPLEGNPLIFHQHGIVKWNTTSVSASILEVQVELLVIGIGMSSSIDPLPIILTRSDNVFDFDLTLLIPASLPAQDIDYTIQGYYYHTAYPADQRTLETIPMKLRVEPYSLVAFREISDGDNAQVAKKRWTTIDISLLNQGNSDDVYRVSIECIGAAKVRYDMTPLSVPRDDYKKFRFDVYAESSEPAIVVVHVETEHPMVNDTGEMRFTLYVDETSDLLNENFNVIIGSIAALFMIVAVVVVIVIFIKRKGRTRRLPRGHG